MPEAQLPACLAYSPDAFAVLHDLRLALPAAQREKGVCFVLLAENNEKIARYEKNGEFYQK